MLSQSLILTLLGMGVVFSFLTIMIGFISLNSKLIKLLKLDREENTASAAAPAQGVNGTNTAVIAAIAAAVREKQNS